MNKIKKKMSRLPSHDTFGKMPWVLVSGVIGLSDTIFAEKRVREKRFLIGNLFKPHGTRRGS